MKLTFVNYYKYNFTFRGEDKNLYVYRGGGDGGSPYNLDIDAVMEWPDERMNELEMYPEENK